MSSGLAKRTIKNLDFIKNAALAEEDVHPVTQVVNSLLALLVFPYAKEQEFFEMFVRLKFDDPSDLEGVCATLTEQLPVPSLNVADFKGCKNFKDFFRRTRNAISHKNLEFKSADPASRILADVRVTLKDQPFSRGKPTGPVDWEISLTAEDLENLSRYIAMRMIERGL